MEGEESKGPCRPVPAPRRLYPELPPKKQYENVTIDLINKNVNIKTENINNTVRKHTPDKLPNNKLFMGVAAAATDDLNGGGAAVTPPNYSRNILTETNDLYGPNANELQPSTLPNDQTAVAVSPTTATATATAATTKAMTAKPSPAPRPRKPQNTDTSMEDIYVNAGPQGMAASQDVGPPVLRRAPQLPPKLCGNNASLDRSQPKQQRHSVTSELSTTSSYNNSNNDNNDNCNGNDNSNAAAGGSTPLNNNKFGGSSATIDSADSSESARFKSPSPGDLLKSLGATSKLLSESIGERVALKAKGAKHKMDKNFKVSSEAINNFSLETTSRLKKFGTNFTLGKRDNKDNKNKENMPAATFYEAHRPQTLPPNDQMFNTISFSSPLQRKAAGLDDLHARELDASYDMPSKMNVSRSVADVREPPPYEDVIASDAQQPRGFDRNSGSSRSVMVPKHIAAEAASVALHKQRSNPNLMKITEEPSQLMFSLSRESRDSVDMPSLPMPAYPPPALPSSLTPSTDAESTYGKLNLIQPPVRLKRRKNYEHIQLRRTGDSPSSMRGNVDSVELHRLNLEAAVAERKESLMLRQQQKTEEARTPKPDRSDSWEYFEDSRGDSECSSPEPTYANHEATYGRVFDMSTTTSPGELPLAPKSPLPQSADSESREEGGAVGGAWARPPQEIIREFDPLTARKASTICRSSKSNQLLLLEHLLEEDTYGAVNVSVASKSDDDVSMCTSEEDNNLNGASRSPAVAPDSPRAQLPPSSPPAAGGLSLGAQQLQIVHQNAQLLSDSMENMLDDTESRARPYLSRVVDNDAAANTSPVDLARPPTKRTNWFVQDIKMENTSPSATRVNPFNKLNKLNIDDDESPPPYLEAIGADGKPTNGGSPSDGKSRATRFMNSSLNMFSNVRIRMDALTRRTSFKGQRAPSVKVTLQMVPRPSLSQMLVRYEGQLVRFPSGVVEDILKEMQNRRAILRDRQFQTFLDHEMKTPKEVIPLECITTIQCVSNNRITDSSNQFYCFEIAIAVPKNSGGVAGGGGGGAGGSASSPGVQAMSNPNLIMTSGTSGNCKHQRVTHLYGVIKESERDIWMQKLLESLTNCVPPKYNCHYYRAGWCYLKNSITSEWGGTWLVLRKSQRRLIYVSESNGNVEKMDLRKARCLVLKDSDETIQNLHVETGPMLMIDCPPFTVYIIMSAPRDTKIWRHIIREVAHNNGFSLNDQQLTKYNVPVIVDKCINFVYIHGSMSEGIYRKSGSENSISKLMAAFRADAFNVEITRNEYNEHDVANVLKRFMRDLPERLLGKLSESFICVSELNKSTEKIPIYKELLSRLTVIERESLRKIVGHLAFISSQKTKNKMSVQNLCLIWGPTLLKGHQSEQMEYSQKEADVLADLILLNKNLFPLSVDEMKREQEMLICLQKYYAAAETLTDSVKQSGDLKLWITVNPNPEKEDEEKAQINVTISPTKTAYELCKELAPKMQMPAHAFCVYEVILNGNLDRPLHHDVKIFEVVLNWSYWPEGDRKHNYLVVKPLGVLNEVQRVIKNMAIVTPCKDLKFADNRTKSFKSYLCELRDGKIVVSKKDKNDKTTIVRELFLHNCTAYLGCEKKRDGNWNWAITFVERTQSQILRSRDAPFIGHVLTSNEWVDRIIWFSSIWYCLHGDNILPPAEIIFK